MAVSWFRVSAPYLLVLILWAAAVCEGSAQTLAPRSSSTLPESDLQRIEQALPGKALVRPGQVRKLLIFDLNVGYGGHPSAKYATEAFRRMGEKTGAFQAIHSQDPSVFLPENLRQFDAVFFNNTVGNLFVDPHLRQSLVDFVYGGGGLMGVHGTTVAFTKWPGAVEDWPEFGILLGGRGANHRESKEHVFIKLDDADHPLNKVFDGQGFDYRDEFFRVHDTYSRNRVRVLFSIDTEKTDMKQGPAYGNLVRADNDYALAWIRNYGRGRIFYCTIAHNPYVFWDPKMLQFYLGAIQFAAGDLACPTIPSGRLTPAIRAQEQLGWRFGLKIAGDLTVFESIDLANRLGLLYWSATWGQPFTRESSKSFDDQLSEDDLRQIRLKLDLAAVRLLGCEVPQFPSGQAALRRLFAFAKKMGIEVLSGNPLPQDLDLAESLCEEFQIQLALRSPAWMPQEILQQCGNRGSRIGAAGDVEGWRQAKMDPIGVIHLLRDRLITLRLSPPPLSNSPGLNPAGKRDVDSMEPIMKEMARLNIRPAMISMTLTSSGTNTPPVVESTIGKFNDLAIKIAREPGAAPPLR